MRIKIIFALAAALAFSNASALPITGKLEFFAEGYFVESDGSAAETEDEVTGAEFLPISFGPYIGTEVGLTTKATGDILDMLLAGPLPASATGGGAPLDVEDFNLAVSVPALQWVLGPVVVSGADGKLSFTITDGGPTDSLATTANFDMGGSGFFSFECTDTVDICAGLDSGTDTIDDTVGSWSISNTGNGEFILGINVPAPGALGLLGVALVLVGLGRRKQIRG